MSSIKSEGSEQKAKYANFTPSEIHIANLIKYGIYFPILPW